MKEWILHRLISLLYEPEELSTSEYTHTYIGFIRSEDYNRSKK